jgi:hypothetical protein
MTSQYNTTQITQTNYDDAPEYNDYEYVPTVFQPISFKGTKERNLIYIPNELKQSSIWLLAADEEGQPDGKIPHIVTDSDMLQRYNKRMGHDTLPYVMVDSFNEKYGYDLGIVLTTADHLAVIDLDAKGLPEADKQTRLKGFHQIIKAFDSYTELSKSGEGYHIIIKTEKLIAKNFRKFGIEIYSYKDRFMLLTGNRVSTITSSGDDSTEEVIDVVEEYKLPRSNALAKSINDPIGYREAQVTALLAQLGYNEEEEIISELAEVPSNLSDDEVVDNILDSAFADKFSHIRTFNNNTDWETTHYPSASEAVLAYFNIVCRFTKSNEQAKRIFKSAPLSLRDKYAKNDYHINRCLTIIRSELNMTHVNTYVENVVNMYYEKQKEIFDKRIENEKLAMADCTSEDDVDLTAIENEYEEANEAFKDIPFPSGLIGEIAKYSMASAPHKLKVAHIAAALVCISAIAGRQVRFKGSSLNLAIIVVANSTMGKETCSSTLSAIAKATAPVGGDKFFCFDKISSGGALRQLMSNSEYGSIGATLPEFAQLIEQMKQGKDGAMGGLKAELLDAVTKNKLNSQYGGSQHANSENNRGSMESPAFSLIGDTVPDFYEGITEEMCSGGFLSRFIILEHYSTIKHKSDKFAHTVQVPKNVIDDLGYLIQQVTSLYNRKDTVEVKLDDPLVFEEADRLENYLTLKFNTSKDEGYRQIYGRAYLKVMVIASLLAFTRNLGDPSISMEDFQWARNLVMRDVFNMANKLRDGSVGVSEQNCKRRVMALIYKLVKHPKERDKTAKNYGHLLDLGIFPRSLMTQRLQGNSFKIGQMSNIKTLELILDSAVKNGEIAVLTDSAKELVAKHTGRTIRGVYYQLLEAKYVDKLADIQASLTI